MLSAVRCSRCRTNCRGRVDRETTAVPVQMKDGADRLACLAALSMNQHCSTVPVVCRRLAGFQEGVVKCVSGGVWNPFKCHCPDQRRLPKLTLAVSHDLSIWFAPRRRRVAPLDREVLPSLVTRSTFLEAR